MITRINCLNLSGVVASTLSRCATSLDRFCLGDPIGSAPRRLCHRLAIFLASLVARATPGSAIAGGGGRGGEVGSLQGKEGKGRVEMLFFESQQHPIFLQKLLGQWQCSWNIFFVI